MIGFEVLSAENVEGLLDGLSQKCPEADAEYLSEIANQLISLEDGCEYALSSTFGCLLVRVFDGEYFFLFPEPVADSYNLTEAISALRAYALREEIPLVISEVPEEHLAGVASLFKNVRVEADNEDEGIFTVRAMSEIALSDGLPEASDGEILLCALSRRDEKSYARLCRDADTNRYWGYNYSEDFSDEKGDAWFIKCAEEELSRGVAASFALRLGDEFIGEAVLYSFDLSGGAECAIRLLPEYRGRGLSERCMNLLSSVSEHLGLDRLFATVDNRNERSLKLFAKKFNPIEKDNEKTRFLKRL